MSQLQHQQQQKNSFNLGNDAVMIRTITGTINSWDNRSVELYGWRKEEAVGKISHDLLKTQFPKPLEEIDSEIARNGLWEGELVHTTRDGRRVLVDSRWALDLNDTMELVVEKNTPVAEAKTDSKAFIKLYKVMANLSNVVLVGGAFLSIFVALYYMFNYGWTGQRQFASSVSKLIHYVVPVGIASLLLASLRFKPSYKINLAFTCVALFATLLGAESFLQWADSRSSEFAKPVISRLLNGSLDEQKAALELTKRSGVKIDTRSAGEVIADFREKGVDAVPIITPSNNLFIKQPDGSIKSALMINGRELMPLAGLANKVTLLCNENGQWVDYRSDRHGFNNPDDLWQSRHIEIAALGDSFAHGYCVPADKNFIARIRQRYPATLNLGVAGDGPLLMLATLQEYLPRFKPKIVLWFYYEGNDLTDLQIERNSALLRNYLQDDFTQRGLARQSDIDRAIMDDLPRQDAMQRVNRVRREKNREIEIGKIINFAKLAALRRRLGMIGGVTREDAAELADLEGLNMETFRDVLSQAKRRVGAWGGQLYFVYLPEWAHYSNYTSWGEKSQRGVFNLVRELGIPIVDADAAFQARGDPLQLFPFREVGHYNETGHRLVADLVLGSLPSSNLDGAD